MSKKWGFYLRRMRYYCSNSICKALPMASWLWILWNQNSADWSGSLPGNVICILDSEQMQVCHGPESYDLLCMKMSAMLLPLETLSKDEPRLEPLSGKNKKTRISIIWKLIKLKIWLLSENTPSQIPELELSPVREYQLEIPPVLWFLAGANPLIPGKSKGSHMWLRNMSKAFGRIIETSTDLRVGMTNQ